ncbi:hypothetical protein EGH10_07840 [Brevibacillus laterosporus]|uniref:Uncharacterized protein n=1 Tax=Brevibacillus laterosporus LMG 15441 TaxID=1042163 RepID=A0A075QXX2_BRELA|nr:hypothetical protein [Brevibacillus laterosporus]AIG25197.1 hypothetical protein BRLA_c008560 [Brevibacillus laterosporus LMG 15441]RJL08575.1 hypothetical protein DM460_17165 [Brevibacillus laterosporus]TPH14505.1 hypothetical protein EGH10_07840 [Brevibacillus laterosporus]HAS01463.1 hypothetical protein [Brevibacillus sp.]
MKRIMTVLSLSALLVIPTTGGNVLASESNELSLERNVTENYEVDFEKWPTSDLSSEIELSVNVYTNSFSSQGFDFKSLATGKTKLSSSDSEVKSTGKTKGKTLSTVVSATTGLFKDGESLGESDKAIAIGKLTATAEKSYFSNKWKKNKFEGVTVHTATYDGVLYDDATADKFVK